MLNVQTILAGFSVILLALIAPRAGQGGLLAPVSLGLVVVALLFLAYSAERSSDALDRRDPWQYTGALSFYNFGVLFLLAGLAAFLTQVGLDSLHASGGLSVGSVAVFVAAAILGGFGVYVWGWDSFWLLKPANRVAHTFVMESGEID